MSLELMRRWVASLPPAERNLPMLHVGDAFYTPLQALYEVERGTAIGEKLQQLVEQGRFGTDLTALARARLQILLKELKGYKIATLSGYAYSPAQLERLLKEGQLNNPVLQLLAKADITLAEQYLKLGKKLAGGGV